MGPYLNSTLPSRRRVQEAQPRGPASLRSLCIGILPMGLTSGAGKGRQRQCRSGAVLPAKCWHRSPRPWVSIGRKRAPFLWRCVFALRAVSARWRCSAARDNKSLDSPLLWFKTAHCWFGVFFLRFCRQFVAQFDQWLNLRLLRFQARRAVLVIEPCAAILQVAL